MSSPPANPNPLLIVISGPSGGGKTTLCEEVLAKRPNIIRAITCTTRDPRKGEQDGVDYYFLDAATFLKRVQAGNFLLAVGTVSPTDEVARGALLLPTCISYPHLNIN